MQGQPYYKWEQHGSVVHHRGEFPQPVMNTRLKVAIVPNEADPAGRRGTYLVTLVLAIPGKGLYHEEANMNMILESGDSLLQLHPGVASADVSLSREEALAGVVFQSNDQGYLAQATLRLTAEDFIDAEKQAHDIILPMLSCLSFWYDVAIDVSTYKLVEETTRVEVIGLNVLGQRKQPASPIEVRVLDPMFRLLLASYREGMNATNPFYQMICFWKVTEGVKQLRRQLGEEARAARREFRRPRERLPEDASEIPGFPTSDNVMQSWLGTSFTYVLDNELQDAFRNAIAHLDPMRSVLTIDNIDDVKAAERAVPIIRYISRVMLGNELQMPWVPGEQ